MISVCASMSQIEEQREEIGSDCYYQYIFFTYIYFWYLSKICSCCIWLMMFKGTNEDVKGDKSWMCTFLRLDYFYWTSFIRCLFGLAQCSGNQWWWFTPRGFSKEKFKQNTAKKIFLPHLTFWLIVFFHEQKQNLVSLIYF